MVEVMNVNNIRLNPFHPFYQAACSQDTASSFLAPNACIDEAMEFVVYNVTYLIRTGIFTMVLSVCDI